MPLIEQRNRFLSFAFASSDILVETDREGRVHYAAGAVAALGTPELKGGGEGEDFAKRLDCTSRPIFRALNMRAKAGRRLGPVRVSIGGRAARLSGWSLDTDARICWSLSFESIDAPEELDPAAFARSAQDAIAKARADGVEMSMSVLRIDTPDSLEDALGEDEAARLRQSIAASCSLRVGSTGVARQIDAARTALIHSRNAELDTLKTEIEDSLRACRIADARVRIESVCDTPDLDPATTVQAFMYAINQAAESDAVLDIASLHEVAERMMEETRKRMTELRTTIAGRVVEPHAQPIVDLATGQIDRYELLLRLPGGQPVQESVGFAENTGIIHEIDLAMTEIAAEFLRGDFDRPSLCVNLSGRSLTNMAWSKRFLALLADLKIDRKRLSFELTETAAVKNVKAANAVIQKIRERGHQVCLDDFGAGSAGLHYLRQFPVDIVKIDGSYIRRSDRSERDAKLLKGIIDICTQLGTKTVAEMIESEDQAARMKSMGVAYGQGFYFGKPVALNKLKALGSDATRAA